MSPYSCARIAPDGAWNGEYGLRLPFTGMHNLMVRGVTKIMGRRLANHPKAFEESFCFNRCEQCVFRWERVASTAGMVSIVAGSKPVSFSALLSGLNSVNDEMASAALEARVSADAKWGLAQIVLNRPVVMAVTLQAEMKTLIGEDLLNQAFADVYFLSIGALGQAFINNAVSSKVSK